MGLWIIQSIRRELNGVSYVHGRQDRAAADKEWSFSALTAEAKKAEAFPSVVDVDLDCFLSPDSMIHTIQEVCRKTEQPVPETIGEIMQCVYTSLAACYKSAIGQLQAITGKTYTSINIVGGGCQDAYLNRRTARAVGLPVFSGPVEGTAAGNLIVQMIACGELDSLQAARNMVRGSFQIFREDP